jgi:hypothetical protein
VSTAAKKGRKRAKDGTFRGGARPGAGRKPKAPARLEPSPVQEDAAYAADLLSRVMRDDGRSLEMRVRAAAALLNRSAPAPTTPSPVD